MQFPLKETPAMAYSFHDETLMHMKMDKENDRLIFSFPQGFDMAKKDYSDGGVSMILDNVSWCFSDVTFYREKELSVEDTEDEIDSLEEVIEKALGKLEEMEALADEMIPEVTEMESFRLNLPTFYEILYGSGVETPFGKLVGGTFTWLYAYTGYESVLIQGWWNDNNQSFSVEFSISTEAISFEEEKVAK